MKILSLLSIGISICALSTSARGEVKVTQDHNASESASAAFKFKNVPAPSKTDAATNAKFRVVDGEQDSNGGDLEKLSDGKLPSEEDKPEDNFFFNAGTDGGRLLIDLGKETEVKQVNTYSWHPGTRGPQVYQLYASDGKAEGFNARPKAPADPTKAGWKMVAKVDTRPKAGEGGGQYGVSIADSEGILGNYRYLLFAISQTEADDAFGNTFYSEIDVVGKDGQSSSTTQPAAADAAYVIKSTDGKCEITIDTSGAPELKEWAEGKLAPVLAEWYPKIAALIPSEG